MAKKNFYAVKEGRKIGIFKTWEECSDSVTGFKGAKYKGFTEYEEAQEFLKGIKYKNDNNVGQKKLDTEYYTSETYYVVRKGRKEGLYGTWEECKAEINGYSGAEYKKIKGKKEALEYLNNNIKVKKKEESKAIISKRTRNKEIKLNTKFGYDVKPIRSQARVTSSKSYINPKNIKNQYEFIAFVDGSYDKVSKTYGSGVIVLDVDNDSYDTLFKAGYDEWDQWNIVGELESTKLALNKAVELGIRNIAIYHDLKNISLWANGEWQAKNKYTQEYVKFIEDMSKSLNICFIKVKAHSDESIYNDLADEAAKRAILDYRK